MSLKRIFYQLPIYIGVFACISLFTGHSAHATTSDPLKNATVNLYCQLKTKGKTFSASGSGVVVSEQGVILTNAHVAQFFLLADTGGRVDGRCSVRTHSPARARYAASLLYLPAIWIKENTSPSFRKKPPQVGENDFALLYITDTTKKGVLPEHFPFLPINTTSHIAEQETISVAGYPTEKLAFSAVQNKLKVVTASSSITNTRGFRGKELDILTLTPSPAGSPGVSGGPIINTSGEVIGIVTSKSAAKDSHILRGITTNYIDRVLQSKEQTSLNSLLIENFSTRAASTSAAFSPKIIKEMESDFLKQKH